MKRRPWGTGTIERQGERFRARFPFRTGQREELDGSPFASYQAAEAALDAILEALRDAGTARGGKTLLKLGESVLDRREKEGYRAVKDERNRWKCYVESWEPAKGSARLVTRVEVRDWLTELAGRGLAVQTRRNALNLLRAVFAAGLDEGHVDENPCVGLKVKSHGRTDDTSTWLSAEEVDRLVALATDPAVALAIGTGMRSGELRALRWDDVHEDHIIVRYGAPPKKPRKNGKILRVPILPLARLALDALPRTHPMVLPSVTGHFRPKGRLLTPKDWKAWKEAAGVTRRVRTHDLRHTTATLLLTGAWGRLWTLEEVKEMLGHSSIKVTERYARATGTLAERAAREMERPEEGPKRVGAEMAQAREIIQRRGSDSNRRMTVLQTVA